MAGFYAYLGGLHWLRFMKCASCMQSIKDISTAEIGSAKSDELLASPS